MKTTFKFLTLAVIFLAAPALAADGDSGVLNKGLAAIGAGLAGLGAAIGIGILAGRLLEAISRQPELEKNLMARFFLTAGLVDVVPFVAIVLALLAMFL